MRATPALTALPTAALLTAALLAGAACGAPEAGDTAGAAVFDPVTVEHSYGATEFAAAPRTVVSLSPAWTDTLVALEVPVAAEFGYEGYSGPYPWTPAHGAERATFTDVLDEVERIASYQPDVILAGYVPDQATYDALAEIAPTIPVMDPGAVLDTWEDIALTAGEVFDKQEQAQGLVGDVTAQVQAVRAGFAAAQGRTFSFGQFTGDQYGLVAAETDPAARLLGSLGMVLDPKAVAVADGADRVLVSLEQVAVLGADLLLMWPLGDPADLDPLPGWRELPAVAGGTLLLVDDVTASTFANPSVYSVPFALDLLRPALGNL